MIGFRVGFFVAAVMAIAGCSGATTPAERPGGAIRSGWTRTDVAVPSAVRSMERIGPAGSGQLDVAGIVVVNFWSSTCGPCRREMPLLERLSRSGVRVVGVSRDNVLKFARQEIRDRGVTFPNYSDASADVMFGLRRVLYPNGIPTTIIVSRGRVLWVHIGPFTSYSDLQREVSGRISSLK